MQTTVVAVTVALLSGFAGAWLGAWITTRHERAEQLRTRRIEAADELVQEWADTLFAGAINVGPTTSDGSPIVSAKTHRMIAIKRSVRVDLLFGTMSLPSAITNVIRDETAAAIEALTKGDVNTARKHHAEASVVQSALVIALGIVIEFTGMSRFGQWRQKDHRTLNEMTQVFKPNAVDIGTMRRALERVRGLRAAP